MKVKKVCRNCAHAAWLERPFEDVDTGLRIYGFCRRMGQMEPIKFPHFGCEIYMEGVIPQPSAEQVAGEILLALHKTEGFGITRLRRLMNTVAVNIANAYDPHSAVREIEKKYDIGIKDKIRKD